jgi:hypothetical protein
VKLKLHIETTPDKEGADGWWRKFQRGTSLRIIPYVYNPFRFSCKGSGLLTGLPKIPNSGSSGTTHLPLPAITTQSLNPEGRKNRFLRKKLRRNE